MVHDILVTPAPPLPPHLSLPHPMNPPFLFQFSIDLRVRAPLHPQQPRVGGFAKEAREGVGRDGGRGVPLAVSSQSAEAGERRGGRPVSRRHRLRVFRASHSIPIPMCIPQFCDMNDTVALTIVRFLSF